jgi:hypothetical protein
MRYECDDPEFVGDFIEFSDSFSRGQQRAIDNASKNEELLLSLLRPKIKGLHLSCIGTEPITRTEDLTPEHTEAMDLRLYGWFIFSIWTHLRGLTDLGNALGRRLLATSATIATMVADPVNQNHS